MAKSELALLFNPDNDGEPVLSQLDKEFDEHHVAGQLKTIPSLIVCSKVTWVRLEMELYPIFTSKGKLIKEPKVVPKDGYSSLIYRARPIVAVNGNDIVSARVGVLDV